MKKIISLILSTAMLISLFPAISYAENLQEWPARSYYINEPLSYKPVDNYYSTQNAPCFVWPIVYNSTYDLIITSDKELTDIKYKREGLKYNLYTFPYTFEAGKTYYWAVRFKNSSGYSKWSDARRFYIDEDASEYTVAEVSDIASLVKATPHPRIAIGDMKNDYKNIDKTSEAYKKFINQIERYVKLGVPEKPNSYNVNTDMATTIVSKYREDINSAVACTIGFFVTGETKYRDYAISMLYALRDLDPSKLFEFNSYTDTAESIFSFDAACVYDWLYEYMTDEQRSSAEKLIENNIKRPYKEFCKDGKFERSLYAEPFGSHQYRINMCMFAALAIYEKSKVARDLVEYHYPLFCSLLYPYSYEDGSSAQGPFYGMNVEYHPFSLMLSNMKLADISKRAYLRNYNTSLFYLWNDKWVNNIGDSYNSRPDSTFQVKCMQLYHSFCNYGDETNSYAKWFLRRINDGSEQYSYPNEPSSFLFNANNNTAKSKNPAALATARYFPDSGWIGMYSDISDQQKMGMIFKSSWYGSHNHSHPDQNSFVIQAYGQTLAIDSDYYDYYHSTFDLGWNKKTYAHNAITYDDGLGQSANDIGKKGKITGFVNQQDFGLAAGDATVAYSPVLEKAKRDIIYVKPGTYIVIDDLEVKKGENTWEFWLNTEGDINVFEGQNGAQITNNDAQMEVMLHYPEKASTNYIDVFAGPDLEVVPTPKMAENSTHKRIYFQTEKTHATKMVTTINTHRTGEDASPVKAKNYGDYMKLQFRDGTVSYINLTDNEEITTKDDIVFKGLSFTYNKDSYIINNGTYLSINKKKLFESDIPVSLGFGKNEISVSSIDKDANITLYGININSLKQHYNSRLRDIPENENKYGTLWNKNEGNISLSVYPGTYTYFLNDHLVPGTEKEGIITVNIDGVDKKIPFTGIYTPDGKLEYDYYPSDINGFYRVEDYKDLTKMGLEKGKILTINSKSSFMTTSDKPYIKLKSLTTDPVPGTVSESPNTLAPELSVSLRATDYVKAPLGSSVVYWERISNTTLQTANAPAEKFEYDLTVPEDGTYDLAISCSTVSQDTSDKFFELGGKTGSFNIPATEVYSKLQGLRISTKIYLTKGVHRLTMLNLDAGQVIYDWIGLIKSDK